MKIVTVVGARPQFIKAATVSRVLASLTERVTEVLVHTGQHYDSNMSDVFFAELDIPEPQYNLNVGGGTHGENTGRMLEKIEKVLIDEAPDWVLVYGDTDSTLAGALAAAKLQIPLAHVEAGLRSWNRAMPEEINRVLTDHAANLLFAPTATATNNLANEGIRGDRVRLVGDVMYDAALYYSRRAEEKSRILQTLNVDPRTYVLATVHRQENSDTCDNLRGILDGIARSPLRVIWPVHPRTRHRLGAFGLEVPRTVQVIDPVGYLDMVMLEKNAAVVVTDSGGVQKEAYFHGVPCLILRKETEWVELVEIGASCLVGTNADLISRHLTARSLRATEHRSLFGDGDAAGAIVRSIIG